MKNACQYILNQFPYPIAYPYQLVFDGNEKPSIRRWSLCFTVYQLLRMVCLPLVSQYLREKIDQSSQSSIVSIRTSINSIRSPFFSDWITLVHTLSRHLPKVGIVPLFPDLDSALRSLKEKVSALPIGARGTHDLDPLNAILALRNDVAHSGIPDETLASQHLETYLPILHQILNAFDFIGESELKVLCDELTVAYTGSAKVRVLRGVRIEDASEQDLTEEEITVFEESQAIMVNPLGKVVPLYPLFKPTVERDPVYLYDGHYGIQIQANQSHEERSYIYYLGTSHRATDGLACDRLKELLAKREIDFFLPKERTAPWTIADSAGDYSRRTLDELVGPKYFPECYIPFIDLERHFESFIQIPDTETWDTDTHHRQYVNGLILTGTVGSGKTAFLAHQVEKLLKHGRDLEDRENPNLVLFLRGDSITLRSRGMSLFSDIAEKLGIAVGESSANVRTQGRFSSFRELMETLHQRWRQDRVKGRRLIILLDALNEAPHAEEIIREALDMVGIASCFPWCKLVLSLRQEWLGLWPQKMDAQEISPLEKLRPFLYVVEASTRDDDEGSAVTEGDVLPLVTIESFAEDQAREVYNCYQERPRQLQDGRSRTIACKTCWDELPLPTRELLKKPLYLQLFMEAFDGQEFGMVSNVQALFGYYVERLLRERPGLGNCIEAVVEYLVKAPTRPDANLTDDDCNRIRLKWMEGLTSVESRLILSPVEALVHEGLMKKSVRWEGGGCRFVYQAVAEYMIYWYLDRTRPQVEDEITYWTKYTVHKSVFPEYSGAFQFLLRDWAVQKKMSPIVRLVETSPDWLQDVMVSFLVEQAQTGYVSGEGNVEFKSMVLKLSEIGGSKCAVALYNAGRRLIHTRFALAATICFQSSVAISRNLWTDGSASVKIGITLARALSNLGVLLQDAGQFDEAETACRQSIKLYESLGTGGTADANVQNGLAITLDTLGLLQKSAGRFEGAEESYSKSIGIREALREIYPDSVQIANGLGRTLNRQAGLLWRVGKIHEAESSYRKSIEVREYLQNLSTRSVNAANGLGSALNGLAALLRRSGRFREAEASYRRSVEVRENLWVENPENLRIGHGLANALNGLGVLLRDMGSSREAEEAFVRSIEIYKSLRIGRTENIRISRNMAMTLTNLAALLRKVDRSEEAEKMFRHSIELCEELWKSSPENLDVGSVLGDSLNGLGKLLRRVGRLDEAETAYRRSIEVRETLLKSNPENIDIINDLGMCLNGLGALLRKVGRSDEAEDAYRRSIELRETLHASNPDNIQIINGLASALNNLGLLMQRAGRLHEAEKSYRRSVELRESVWTANTENIKVGNGLGNALDHLGSVYKSMGKVIQSQDAYQRAADIYESLWASYPGNKDVQSGLRNVLNHLGDLLKSMGKIAEARDAYQRSSEIMNI